MRKDIENHFESIHSDWLKFERIRIWLTQQNFQNKNVIQSFFWILNNMDFNSF